MTTLDPKKASKDDIARGLELLAKAEDRKARIKSGEIKGGQSWAELSPEARQKRLDYSRVRRIKQTLLCNKAIEAGITVTEPEVQAEMERLAAAA